MRLQFIICKVMQKEAYLCASRSKNIIDIVLMPQGLHDEPEKLRQQIQESINNTKDIQGNDYDATLLGYGLCSNGIVGLTSKITLVVPRGHDCMTLLIGSKDKYQQYFDTHKGIYWYSPGWLETTDMPGKDRHKKLLEQYQQKYGHDNAEFLMETEQNWMREYNWATYIDWELPNNDEEKKYTKKCAEFMNWKYDEVKGDSQLMQNLLDGNWNEKDFLTIKPGQTIKEDLTNPGIVKAQ